MIVRSRRLVWGLTATDGTELVQENEMSFLRADRDRPIRFSPNELGRRSLSSAGKVRWKTRTSLEKAEPNHRSSLR